jgi:hypothetical protein
LELSHDLKHFIHHFVAMQPFLMLAAVAANIEPVMVGVEKQHRPRFILRGPLLGPDPPARMHELTDIRVSLPDHRSEGHRLADTRYVAWRRHCGVSLDQ